MTLMEVLIAAVLLAFVIASSLTALSAAYRFTRHARMITLAGQVGQSIMEDLRIKNFTVLQGYAAQAQPVDFSAALTSERFASNFTQGFTVSGAFSTLAVSGGSQLGKISVTLTVNWSEQNKPYSRSLITYFGEKGLSDYLYVGWAP
jgi:Tfp pilus assembly protein PilV